MFKQISSAEVLLCETLHAGMPCCLRDMSERKSSSHAGCLSPSSQLWQWVLEAD